MLKACKICGKEFEAKQKNYKYCSDKCRNIALQSQKKICYARWYDKGHEQRKERDRKHAPVIKCRICGKEVPKVYTDERVHYSHYHEECIVSTALTAIRNGERLVRSKPLRRAVNKGYTIGELKRLLKEREINA